MNDQSAPLRKVSVPSSMFTRLRRLIGKELAETLRDRRTIVTLVLMPVLVYPLLSILLRQFVLSTLGGGEVVPVIGVESREVGNFVVGLIEQGSRELQRQEETSPDRRWDTPPLIKEPTKHVPRIEVRTDLERRVRDGAIDVGIRLVGEEKRIELLYAPDSTISPAIRGFVERRIHAVEEAFRAERERRAGLPPHSTMISVVKIDLPKERRSFLPTLIPMVLLLMTITGAVYPAIDLTAGERERGTLESLIAAPIARVELLIAKYAAVLTVALLTAGVNLAAMTFTLYGSGLASWILGEQGVTVKLIAQTGGLLLLFAGFFSAVLLVVTSFAKSFKEAQAYLIPLMLVTLAPGMMSLRPDLKLTSLTAVTPLMNIVLLARDLFTNELRTETAAIVVGATILYAIVALALAARIFGSDAILYGSLGTWSDLLRRSPIKNREVSIAGAFTALAFVFAVKVNLAGWIGAFLGELPDEGLLLVIGATALLMLFAVVPLVTCRLENAAWSSSLGLRLAHPTAFLGAILIGSAVWLFVHEALVRLESGEWITINEHIKALLKSKKDAWLRLPFPLIVICLAVVPAIAEELFFRGLMLRSLLKKLSETQAILATAGIFAAFHVIEAGMMTWERLPSSLVLGLVLAWIAVKTGSVLPGMFLHALNNSILIGRAYFAAQLMASGWMNDKSASAGMLAFVVAAIVVAFGAMLIARTGRIREQLEPERSPA